jgi:cell division protease FtsH
MHTRDYSEHTSQIIDDEVEIILRAQEERALEVLARHRGGLDAVARALLDEETIDGETVGRLVDTAYGRPVHEHGVKSVPPIFVASQHGPTGSDDVDGPPEDADRTAPGRGSEAGTAPAGTAPHGATEATTDSEVSGAARASDETGAAHPRDPGQANGDGRAGSAPWPPPPPPPAGHWPQAPSPMPAPQPPGHWPNQTPWPPPPPPASR